MINIYYQSPTLFEPRTNPHQINTANDYELNIYISEVFFGFRKKIYSISLYDRSSEAFFDKIGSSHKEFRSCTDAFIMKKVLMAGIINNEEYLQIMLLI